MKPKQLEQIVKHGENLNAIFNTGLEPLVLCKKLRRLETKANKLATDYCNGENGINSENWEQKCEPILKAVKKILFAQSYNVQRDKAIFLNGDARGYSLKIKDEFLRNIYKTQGKNIYTDMGGYGILAPEFN